MSEENNEGEWDHDSIATEDAFINAMVIRLRVAALALAGNLYSEGNRPRSRRNDDSLRDAKTLRIVLRILNNYEGEPFD